jgi:twitching motility protein PilU
MDLSLNLRGMIAQQLVPTTDGKGRRAAIEILINTPLVSDLIKKGDVHALKEVMSKSTEQGMQTFDQALFELYSGGEIGYDSALAAADSANDLRLMIKLSGGERSGLSPAAQGLSLESGDDDLTL